MQIRKAVIPAAGLGTRFLPATKALPKEMLPIVDKPTIQYVVEEAVESGITDILIITGRNKRAIEDHFDHSMELEYELERQGKQDILDTVRSISTMVDIHYVRQKQPLGLGHAVYCARKFVGNEPFVVMLGDDIIRSDKPVVKQMIEAYEETKASIVGVQEVALEDTKKYGIVSGKWQTDTLYKVHSLVEKPKNNPPSQLAVMGRYIIKPEIFDILSHIEPGAGGEIQLTDALNILAQTQENGCYAYKFQGKRYDVGDKFGFLQANIEFALEHCDIRSKLREYLDQLSLAKC
ncbi:UTP--glucose-1-phosphate uridylyltransferase [Desulfuribacillus stibiiarsenatis]|uniref:UTP--glucose-1-phosphate uridylyltransferase n=1 Tax=Desulfuribacillus stibiiarsenatis TaxID=1390249 RepID=A0A1E5L5Z2_9FIRM|nr:UTP--glucose-1-phosphate uridylyltransferase GalU [Desulfuribacillus stibiiarsenatis]OEH85567.1 UTP--glucose-1-phosphate uridylyltransferase [Desulfuribacillus stibiiarsenatis]